jgi:hypothetical protein
MKMMLCYLVLFAFLSHGTSAALQGYVDFHLHQLAEYAYAGAWYVVFFR